MKGIVLAGRSEIRLYPITKGISKQLIDRGCAWFDAGTHRSLSGTTDFIQTIETRQGLQVACLVREGWITAERLTALCGHMSKNQYGQYILHLINNAGER